MVDLIRVSMDVEHPSGTVNWFAGTGESVQEALDSAVERMNEFYEGDEITS